jgi:hypothetical protein
MQRAILRHAQPSPCTVREAAQKLFVNPDRTDLGAVRRAMQSLVAADYLRLNGDGLYHRTTKQLPGRREWRVKSHQREMREREAADGRPQDAVIKYTIEPIGQAEAAEFIRRYEWLGNVGHPLARYCARNEAGEVAAVALFGRAHVQAAGLCRAVNPKSLSADDRAYLATVVCLERGACAHWAHRHTASWFLPQALAMASKDHGWKIFYAYSDPTAGEVGTIYQACGWHYIGVGPGRDLKAGKPKPRWQFRQNGDPWVSDRAFYRRTGLSVEDARAGVDGWQMREVPAKGKYVTFIGDKRERRELLRSLRYSVLPYPKCDL